MLAMTCFMISQKAKICNERKMHHYTKPKMCRTQNYRRRKRKTRTKGKPGDREARRSDSKSCRDTHRIANLEKHLEEERPPKKRSDHGRPGSVHKNKTFQNTTTTNVKNARTGKPGDREAQGSPTRARKPGEARRPLHLATNTCRIAC